MFTKICFEWGETSRTLISFPKELKNSVLGNSQKIYED